MIDPLTDANEEFKAALVDGRIVELPDGVANVSRTSPQQPNPDLEWSPYSDLPQSSRDVVSAAELEAETIVRDAQSDRDSLATQAYWLGVSHSGIDFAPGKSVIRLASEVEADGHHKAAYHLFRAITEQHWKILRPDVDAFMVRIDAIWRWTHRKFDVSAEIPESLMDELKARVLRLRAAILEASEQSNQGRNNDPNHKDEVSNLANREISHQGREKSAQPDTPKEIADRVVTVYPNVVKIGGCACDPLFWERFVLEKTSRTSPLREVLIRTGISASIPKEMTDREVVERIAKECGIPIESVSSELDSPVYPRGRAYAGFVGDVFDQLASERLAATEWWLSDKGLNMVPKRVPDRVLNFDELTTPPNFEESIKNVRPRRRGKPDAVVQRIKARVRELKNDRLSHREICERLGSFDRPPRAAWRELPWPKAYLKHTRAVTKWLSDACSGSHS